MVERLPSRARRLLDSDSPAVSPLVVLELEYLHEVGRARDPVPTMVAALRKSLGLEVADASLAELVGAATGLSWTRDPFDRLIAAHAILADATLLTADRTILDNLPQAAWD